MMLDAMTAGAAVPDPAPVPVGPRHVVALQSRRSYPSVSVLLTTEPADQMTDRDRGRLHDLIDQASTRLCWNPHIDDPAPLVAALDAMAESARTAATAQALALCASLDTSRALLLSVTVADRVVIDQTFATRDIVLALQRTPRHLVLVLSTQRAELTSRPAGCCDRPVDAASPCGPPRCPAVGIRPVRWSRPTSGGGWIGGWAPTAPCIPARWCWSDPPRC